jgi:hypothetical protein
LNANEGLVIGLPYGNRARVAARDNRFRTLATALRGVGYQKRFVSMTFWPSMATLNSPKPTLPQWAVDDHLHKIFYTLDKTRPAPGQFLGRQVIARFAVLRRPAPMLLQVLVVPCVFPTDA